MSRLTSAIARAGPSSWARAFLALAGAVLLLIGAIAVLRNDAAAAPLIVGAVLATIGLLDWAEIAFDYKGLSVRLTRVVEKLAAVAHRDDVPAEAKAIVADAGRELESLSEVDVEHRRPGPFAGHRFTSAGMTVWMEPASRFVQYKVKVTEPGGAIRDTRPRWSFAGPPHLGVEALYPSDFEGSPPLPPPRGEYIVEWWEKPLASVSPNYDEQERLVAEDRFSSPF